MKRRLALWIGILLLSPLPQALAQEAGLEEDLRFVRELRARHYSDLAMKYLEALSRGASPELARELTLEKARTRLALASDEPDSSKRLLLYDEARGALEKFLQENPSHPRAAEARLDIAEVTVLQGKTQLSRALLQDSPDAREAEAVKARELFAAADGKLRASAEELKKQVASLDPKTPAERAAAQKLEQASKQANLAVALNSFNQAMSFVNEGKEGQDKLRADKMQEAEKLLEPMAGGDITDPVTWEARAWVGRCQDQLGDPQKARKTYEQIFSTPGPVAATGRRLARYFDLLALEQTIDPKEKQLVPQRILFETERWLREYSAFSQTQEAFGVRYLRARYLISQAEAQKNTAIKENDLLMARRLLGEIERTENDFTDRAKRLKLLVISQQGGFSKKVEDLKSFEDCYVRAQYEAMQMGEDAKKLTGKELKEKRKEHLGTIIKALDRGLSLPDAKSFPMEQNSARTLLTYFAMEARDYARAVEVGETFARADPRSSQAASASVYALEAYNELIKQHEHEDSPSAEEIKALRDRQMSFTEYMIARWPNELAGNVARHELALRRIREEKFPEGIALLDAISPSYRSYTFALYQLANAALVADKNNAPLLPGDKPGGYRQRALAALEKIPMPDASAAPFQQNIYFQAKTMLGYQLFRDKKYKELRDLATRVKELLGTRKLDDDPETDQKQRGELLDKLSDQNLLALYGEADGPFRAGKHAEVAALLDPVVKEFNAGKLDQMKKNLQVGMVLLSMDLQSNVQLGKVDQATEVLNALQTLQAEKGGEKGVDTILSQLALVIRTQVEQLQKKKDEAALKKAVANYKTLIQGLVKTQKSPSARFLLLLGQCFSSMNEHQEAVKVLDTIPAPKADTPPDSEDMKVYQGSRLLLVRELRLSGDPENIKKAGTLLDEIVGTPAKPGWGGKSIDVLLEKVRVFEEAKKYALGAKLANNLVRILIKKASDNTWQDKYLESYYHQVYCVYKFAQEQTDSAKKQKDIHEAAQMMVALEKKWDNFGTSASRKRFEELLSSASDLKEEYTRLKGE